MVIDLIPRENAREVRAEHAAITQAFACDDSPLEMAAMQFALVIYSQT